jgi:hypothetical protein
MSGLTCGGDNYEQPKWALLLSGQILYGDLLSGGRHDIGVRLDRMLANANLLSGGDHLNDKAKLTSLKCIVCTAEVTIVSQ